MCKIFSPAIQIAWNKYNDEKFELFVKLQIICRTRNSFDLLKLD